MITMVYETGIVPVICKMLAMKILKNHQDCMRWNDETANTHECSHLEDAQLIIDFSDEWERARARGVDRRAD